MKTSIVKGLGFGAKGFDASPQPLSKAERLCDLVACESRPPYESASKEFWGVLKYRARENRQGQTEAERILWQAERAGRLGHKIRRQHPVGIYIADFICIMKRVIIEIDGGYHLDTDQVQSDLQRTLVLEQKGFKVIRFTNSEVESSLQTVTSEIKSTLDSLPNIPYEPNM